MSLTRRSTVALGLFSLGHHLIKPVCAVECRVVSPDGRAHSFTLHPEGCRLDGVPMQIRSGEMHPARIPREEWPSRIAMAKAMGLNTISIYLMWNTLERSPGHFDFHTDRCNFPAFIQLCQDAGLWVFFVLVLISAGSGTWEGSRPIFSSMKIFLCEHAIHVF